MNVEVRYLSRGGNTKKLADAIASAAGVEAKNLTAPMNEAVDLLFLGASVYWGGVDQKVKDFIQELDETKVKKVVVFSTSSLAERAFPEIKKLFAGKKVELSEDNFYCR